MVRWRYTVAGRELLACQKCRALIEADDRQGLLERVLQKPLARSVSQSFSARHERTARELHETFWEAQPGAPFPFP